MKVCVGRLLMREKPIFVLRVGLWEAARWHISNTTLSQTLTDRAYTAAGISPKSSSHSEESTFHGAPDYQYEVKIFEYQWEEVKK